MKETKKYKIMRTIKLTILAVILAFGFSSVMAQNQGVAINTDGTQADVSALLDVKSTSAGVLVPRMLMSERDLIATPATGLLIFQTDNTPGFYYFNGSAWQAVSGVGGDTDWTVTGNNMYNNNTGNTGIGTNSPGATLDVEGHIWQTGLGGSTFIGENAGANDDLSLNINTFVGNSAGNSNTSGNENVAMGYQAMSSSTTAQQNIAIGAYSMASSVSGSFNTAVGFNTLLLYNEIGFGSSSQRNTAIGYEAMKGGINVFPPASPSGEGNVAVGYSALFEIIAGDRNTSIGYQSMEYNKNGDYNTAVGNHAGPATDNLNNTTALGDHALATASNQVMLGNAQVTQVKTAGGITIGSTTVSEAGTIRFNTATNHFEGYNGSAWVQLD